MSGLGDLFESVAMGLGQGRRGEALVVEFLVGFGEQPEDHLTEIKQFVKDAVQWLGLADWPGGRLGASLMGFRRLGDCECLKALTEDLVTGGRESHNNEGLGWLAGPLFRSGRLVAYLRAAEEDGGKALAYLRMNIRSELSSLRRAADPVGAALFDNLTAAAIAAVAELEAKAVASPPGGCALVWDKQRFALARGVTMLPAEEHAVAAHREVLVERGALQPFAEAARCNEARPEGQRNLPMRGAKLEAPLMQHDLAWAASEPAHPACEAVDLSALANALRPDFPQAESLREIAVVVDDEGVELWGAARPKSVINGPGPLRDLFTAWRASIAEAPRIGGRRRAKLLNILEVLEPVFLNSLGDLRLGWQAAVREELGLKPQTFSDDWKLLRELLLDSGVSQ